MPFCNSPGLEVVRAPRRCRRNLVFLRAGGGAPWPFGAGWRGAARDFDIAASYFDKPDEGAELYRQADFVLAGGLSKFHAAQKFLQGSPWLAQYDHVMFADEDLRFMFAVDDFFGFCARHGFGLAQPSLTADSYYTYQMTRNHPGLVFRTVNYVETMCPVFAAGHLRRVIDTFGRSISGYGLDIYWSATLPKGQNAAIIDLFQMRHTCPVSPDGPFYRYLESIGVDRWAELGGMLALLGLNEYRVAPLVSHYQPQILRVPEFAGGYSA